MKFSIKDSSNKCDQIRSILRIWSHLPDKPLMENFILRAVDYSLEQSGFDNTISRLNVSKTNLLKFVKRTNTSYISVSIPIRVKNTLQLSSLDSVDYIIRQGFLLGIVSLSVYVWYNNRKNNTLLTSLSQVLCLTIYLPKMNYNYQQDSR